MQKRGHPKVTPLLSIVVRRRPTLPQPLGCSTIGAERLNFRVRYGTGCFPFAMAAVTLAEHTHPHHPVFRGFGGVPSIDDGSIQLSNTIHTMGYVGWELHVDAGTHTHVCRCFVAQDLVVSRPYVTGCGDWFCTVLGQALGLLVPVGWALLLYTSGLSTPCSVGGLTQLTWWETSS